MNQPFPCCQKLETEFTPSKIKCLKRFLFRSQALVVRWPAGVNLFNNVKSSAKNLPGKPKCVPLLLHANTHTHTHICTLTARTSMQPRACQHIQHVKASTQTHTVESFKELINEERLNIIAFFPSMLLKNRTRSRSFFPLFLTHTNTFFWTAGMTDVVAFHFFLPLISHSEHTQESSPVPASCCAAAYARRRSQSGDRRGAGQNLAIWLGLAPDTVRSGDWCTASAYCDSD